MRCGASGATPRRRTPGVSLAALADHLGFAFNAQISRALRPAVDDLVKRGWLVPARRRGVAVWDVAAEGRAVAIGAVASGAVVLPESPQHRLWRTSRGCAEATIGARLEGLGEALADATALLAADPPAAADTWFELADLLHQRARAVGVTVHCLHEWPEPSDDTVDRDELSDRVGDTSAPDRGRRALRRYGRRDVLLWASSASDGTGADERDGAASS